ncbi:MAG: 4Fe-4S dicluster domain-containing protein [Defluviitaleaceae bacterium]|nr:4Fe-4S dicluster domain-containing protein [Defluviitaleaceae bacterium]
MAGILPFFKTILSSLGRKPTTYTYPNAPMPKDQLVRGSVGIDIDNCIFCNICAKKCPADAIVMDKARKEWELARFQCVVCGACVELCPKKCLFMSPELATASDVRVKDKVVKVVEDTMEKEKIKESVTADAPKTQREPVTADA